MRVAERKCFMFIKVYLSEPEKLRLEEMAEAKKVSLSALCYEQIAALLENPVIAMDQLSYEKDVDKGKCTEAVKVYFTKKEYAELSANAGGMPLSKYLRKLYLAYRKPVEISVYTEDISALSLQVSSYVKQLRRFIAGLAVREQLYESDYQYLTQLAEDMQKSLRDVAAAVKANRDSIRASGVRIIRKEIQAALEQLKSGKGGGFS